METRLNSKQICTDIEKFEKFIEAKKAEFQQSGYSFAMFAEIEEVLLTPKKFGILPSFKARRKADQLILGLQNFYNQLIDALAQSRIAKDKILLANLPTKKKLPTDVELKLMNQLEDLRPILLYMGNDELWENMVPIVKEGYEFKEGKLDKSDDIVYLLNHTALQVYNKILNEMGNLRNPKSKKKYVLFNEIVKPVKNILNSQPELMVKSDAGKKLYDRKKEIVSQLDDLIKEKPKKKEMKEKEEINEKEERLNKELEEINAQLNIKQNKQLQEEIAAQKKELNKFLSNNFKNLFYQLIKIKQENLKKLIEEYSNELERIYREESNKVYEKENSLRLDANDLERLKTLCELPDSIFSLSVLIQKRSLGTFNNQDLLANINPRLVQKVMFSCIEEIYKKYQERINILKSDEDKFSFNASAYTQEDPLAEFNSSLNAISHEIFNQPTLERILLCYQRWAMVLMQCYENNDWRGVGIIYGALNNPQFSHILGLLRANSEVFSMERMLVSIETNMIVNTIKSMDVKNQLEKNKSIAKNLKKKNIVVLCPNVDLDKPIEFAKQNVIGAKPQPWETADEYKERMLRDKANEHQVSTIGEIIILNVLNRFEQTKVLLKDSFNKVVEVKIGSQKERVRNSTLLGAQAKIWTDKVKAYAVSAGFDIDKQPANFLYQNSVLFREMDTRYFSSMEEGEWPSKEAENESKKVTEISALLTKLREKDGFVQEPILPTDYIDSVKVGTAKKNIETTNTKAVNSKFIDNKPESSTTSGLKKSTSFGEAEKSLKKNKSTTNFTPTIVAKNKLFQLSQVPKLEVPASTSILPTNKKNKEEEEIEVSGEKVPPYPGTPEVKRERQNSRNLRLRNSVGTDYDTHTIGKAQGAKLFPRLPMNDKKDSISTSVFNLTNDLYNALKIENKANPNQPNEESGYQSRTAFTNKN